MQSQHHQEYCRLVYKNKKKSDSTDKKKFENPRLIFYNNLTKLVRYHLADKRDIFLTGDFNDEIGNKYDDLTQMIEALGLIDIYSYWHGFDSEVGTYNRGSKQLDYMFVTCRMTDHIVAYGYDKYHKVISSDN